MIDWQTFIFNPQEDWIGRMERRARKRFSDENVADEALNYALKKMGDNNWQCLSSYQGRSKPGTFLYTILNNQLEDFSRKKFGYPRPPLWVDRLGVHWKTIWKRLCLERENPKTLLVIYHENKEQTEEIIKTIKSRITGCGQVSSITSIGGTLADDDYDLDNEITKHSQSLSPCDEHMEKQINTNHCESLLSALCQSLDFETEHIDIDAVSSKLSQQTTKFRELFNLNPEQLLLLKLKHQQGYKVTTMSKILNLKEHTVRRNVQRAEKVVFELLLKSGFKMDDFLVK